jgi:hypothetical protein
MAERRMFSKKIADSDRFIMLSQGAQLLYFHLCMSADDDGLTNSCTMCRFKAHAGEKDLKELEDNNFIIIFQSGVIAITDWLVSNSIRKDRYQETQFANEYRQLVKNDNSTYSLVNPAVAPRLPNGCQADTQRLPQDSIGKDSIGKESVEEDSLVEDNILCSEQSEIDTEQKPIIDIILNDKTLYPIYQEDINEWLELYPAVDVIQELRKMKDWSKSNPTKRKTRRGVRRFITNWLMNAQDEGTKRNSKRNGTIDWSKV